MNSILIGNGYWGNIIKPKILKLTNLIAVVDSKTNINEIFRTNNVDVVFICSATSSHYEIVKLCIDYNIQNIFCEKPFTGSYLKAKELFKLSSQKSINIFVDNIFLYRYEVLNSKHKNIKNLKFIWNKKDFNFNENLYDSLLYHDLYLLLKLTNHKKWKIVSKELSDTELHLNMASENMNCVFDYNVNATKKEKKIIINDDIINLSYPQNDPLNDVIEKLLSKDIDFEINKNITLDTLKLMNLIQK